LIIPWGPPGLESAWLRSPMGIPFFFFFFFFFSFFYSFFSVPTSVHGPTLSNLTPHSGFIYRLKPRSFFSTSLTFIFPLDNKVAWVVLISNIFTSELVVGFPSTLPPPPWCLIFALVPLNTPVFFVPYTFHPTVKGILEVHAFFPAFIYRFIAFYRRSCP